MAKVLIYLSEKNLGLIQKLAEERFDGNRSRCVSELTDYIEDLEGDIEKIKKDLKDLHY